METEKTENIEKKELKEDKKEEKKRKVSFAVPNISDLELEKISKVLKTDICDLKIGKTVEELEKRFAEYVGVEEAISTSTGTSALHLAMCAIDLKRGDKVICSINAHPTVPEVIRHFDAEPIFVDIDKGNFNIDVKKLESILSSNKSKKLKAVVVSHFGGYPIDLNKIYNLAKKYGVLIVEDASHILGGYYKDKKIGSLSSDIIAFNFNPYFQDSLADGGMLITSNRKFSKIIKLLKNHGIDSSKWDKSGTLNYVYDIVDVGFKYDMSDISAAYNLAQLEKNNQAIEKRREIAEIYFKELEKTPHVTLPMKKKEHTYQFFVIKIDKNRDSFARELQKRDIEVRVHYIPLHLMSYYKDKYALRINDFPNALRNYQEILSIPIHPKMEKEDVEYVIEKVKEIAENRIW